MVMMMTLAIPAFNAMRGGGDFFSEVYSIAGAFEQARAYAVANNTYVLAGITEVSGAVDSSVSPQVSGTGRVAMAIIASRNGIRPYQGLFPTALNTYVLLGYNNGAAFYIVTKLSTFPNLHLVDLQYSGSQPPASGGMARPALSSTTYDLSSASYPSPTSGFNCQFAWPLGSSLKSGSSPQPQYTFVKVVEFDPQGSARVISTGNPSSYPDNIPPYIEVGLQPSHGRRALGPPQSQTTGAGEIAAVQITGISGAVNTYFP